MQAFSNFQNGLKSLFSLSANLDDDFERMLPVARTMEVRQLPCCTEMMFRIPFWAAIQTWTVLIIEGT